MVARIQDVARRAGVSPGTVSNVFNRPDSVSPATRARVERAVAELNYVRHEPARQLRVGASRTLALVVLDVTNPFYADLITGAEDAADVADALVIVCNSAGSSPREERHLLQLASQRVMGVLLTPGAAGAHIGLAELASRGIPVVLVDRVAHHTTLPSVSVDDFRGGALAGQHLASRGHRWIAIVAGQPDLQQVTDRIAGLRDAVGSAVRVDVVPTDGTSIHDGSQAAARFLDTRDRSAPHPTAVFCTSDMLALGVLNECTRRAIAVPAELAIVGYDDIDLIAAAAVPLTSVRQPRHQLGREAVELLLALTTRDGERDRRRVVLQPELVVRAST